MASVGLLAALALAACDDRNPPVVRVGDAIPRTAKQPTLLDVIRPLLPVAATPRLEIVPWTVPTIDLNVGDAAQARRFIADASVVAVVGHAGSKSTLHVEPMYREAGMPLIVPTATARALRNVGPDVFMLAPPDDAVGAYLVDQALHRPRQPRIGLLYVADPYGDGIRDGVVARLKSVNDSLAGEAALSGRECEHQGEALRAIVTAFLRRSRPDVVLLALPQRATWCAIRQLVQQQPGIEVITSDSFVPLVGFPLSPAERAAVRVLAFWQPGTDSLTQRFVAQTRAVLGRDPEPSQALAFDAFRLVQAAVREGHVTRRAVARWLHELGTPGHPPFQGITGPIDFTAPRTTVMHLQSLGDSVPPP